MTTPLDLTNSERCRWLAIATDASRRHAKYMEWARRAAGPCYLYERRAWVQCARLANKRLRNALTALGYYAERAA